MLSHLDIWLVLRSNGLYYILCSDLMHFRTCSHLVLRSYNFPMDDIVTTYLSWHHRSYNFSMDDIVMTYLSWHLIYHQFIYFYGLHYSSLVGLGPHNHDFNEITKDIKIYHIIRKKTSKKYNKIVVDSLHFSINWCLPQINTCYLFKSFIIRILQFTKA